MMENKIKIPIKEVLGSITVEVNVPRFRIAMLRVRIACLLIRFSCYIAGIVYKAVEQIEGCE